MRISPLLAAGLTVTALLAGCSGKDVTGGGGTASVLDGQVRRVSLAETRQAIDRLYRNHPAIRTFVVRDVEYTPQTRDRVLRVCSRGGAEIDRGQLETSKVFACAPLIFFFDRYGHQASVPESVDVARQLYWYALTHIRGPYEAKRELVHLLRSWGIR